VETLAGYLDDLVGIILPGRTYRCFKLYILLRIDGMQLIGRTSTRAGRDPEANVALYANSPYLVGNRYANAKLSE